MDFEQMVRIKGRNYSRLIMIDVLTRRRTPFIISEYLNVYWPTGVAPPRFLANRGGLVILKTASKGVQGDGNGPRSSFILPVNSGHCNGTQRQRDQR